jgi:hypothetical protein
MNLFTRWVAVVRDGGGKGANEIRSVKGLMKIDGFSVE